MSMQRSKSQNGAPDSNVAARDLPPAVLSVIDTIAPRRQAVADIQQFVKFALVDRTNEVKAAGDEIKQQQLMAISNQMGAEGKDILNKGFREKKDGISDKNLVNGAQKQIFSLKDALYLQCYLYLKKIEPELVGIALYEKMRKLHNNGNPDPKLVADITSISLADNIEAVNQFIKTVGDEYLRNQQETTKLILQMHFKILWQHYREEKTDPQIKNMLGDIFLRACEKFPEYCAGFKVAVKIKDDKQLKDNLKKLKALAQDGVTQLQENLQKMSDDNAIVFINIQMAVKLLLDVLTLIKNFKAKTTEEKEVIGDWLKPMEGLVGQLTEKNAADVMKSIVLNLQTAMSKLTYKSVLRDQLQQLLTVNCKLLADDVAMERMRGDPSYQKDQWASVEKWSVELKNDAPFRVRHAVDAVMELAGKKENEQKRGDAILILEVIDDLLKLPGRYASTKFKSVSTDKAQLMGDALHNVCGTIINAGLNLFAIYNEAANMLSQLAAKIEDPKGTSTLKEMLNEMSEKYKKLAKLNSPEALAKKAVDQTADTSATVKVAEVQSPTRTLGRSSAAQ